MGRNIFFVLCYFMTLSSVAQTKLLYNQSIEAYKNGDFKTFLELNKKLDSIRPMHPTFTYNLAAAYSLNKKDDEALRVLNQVVLANNSISFEEDADFEFIKKTAGFSQLKEVKLHQGKTVESAVFKFDLSQKDLHPEGLLYLSKHKLWLASSIRNKKIVTFNNLGVCDDWLADLPYAVFALKSDANQKYLWVLCSAVPEMKNFTQESDGKCEVLKIDIASRKIIKQIAVDGKHIFGDLIVAKNGDVYISDSNEPSIYKVVNDEISLWKNFAGEAFNLQGITFNEDQSKIFIADYLKGIAVISVNDNSKMSWITFPIEASKKGIDGLVYYKNSLITIQNGVVPIRIVKFDLNNEQNQIANYVVLDNNRTVFNEPALATIVGNKMYFFANSPWKFYDKNGQLDETKIDYPKLYELTFN